MLWWLATWGLSVVVLGGGASCSHALPPVSAGAAQAEEISLVLVLVVDQLRRDRIEPGLPGGLGLLMRRGRSFRAAELAHAATETCPGHATILTGQHPAEAGVPANSVLDRAGGRVVYCMLDESEAGRVHGLGRAAASEGRSPKRMRVSALADWLAAARPGSRAYAVSGKDRAALALAGRGATAAFWLDRTGRLGFTTSAYYLSALPPWLARWDLAGVMRGVPEAWTYEPVVGRSRPRQDDYPAESDANRRTTPHPLARAPEREPGRRVLSTVDRLSVTPYLDARTLDFARDLVVEEQLGAGRVPDLLAIGLSGTDYIGHHYGPWSQESHHALLDLDRRLGEFLAFLDARLGPGRLLVALTADHGVLPLPEWAAEVGPADETCTTVEGGRVSERELDAALAEHLTARFGPPPRLGQAEVGWLLSSHFALLVAPGLDESQAVRRREIIDEAALYLSRQRGVARVWRMEDLASATPSDRADLYRHSYGGHAEFADLVIEPERGCLLTDYPAGTSHGSPHPYDRAVPIVFYGPGVEPGVASVPAHTVDIAPTLARRLGLSPPANLAGRPLPLTD